MSGIVPADPHYAADVLLKDGGSIHLRAIRPDDRARLVDHFQSLSARSVYYRFFGVKHRLTDRELDEFTRLDFVHKVALVATLVDERGEERILGVGRYAVIDESAGTADIAFAVADAHQGRGIGTVLLDHLAAIARRQGIRAFVADVLGENNQMLELFATSGFVATRSWDGGVVHLTFPTEDTDVARSATLGREMHAAAESVRRALAPRAVAVVGASRRPDTIGWALLANLRAAGFKGPIYPVNPAAAEIDGLRCYPSLSAIGAPVDLAVIAVPAPAVEAVVHECAAAGVRAVVVISAGFAEASPDGRILQDRITRFVRAAGMRMIGPNCMGILNTAPDVALNATFAPHWPPVGNVGMLSQSGALGLAILDYAKQLNIGMSTFVSVGNKADVSGNDLLSYWADDPSTRVVVLYLESFGNPRRFARIGPEVARHKPIVAVKSGRSAAGTRAASSHSAALASLDVAVDALFAQAGVIRTETLEELFDVTALLSTQPVPAGRRVGVVTNAGGPGILFADACEARGLELPSLAPHSLDALRELLPAQAGLTNPIDMIASATPEQYARTIAIVGNDPAIDAVVVTYVPPMVSRPEEIAAAIARGAGDVPAHKPVLCVFLSSKGAPDLLSQGPRGKLPAFSYPENAAMALAAAERYARWRMRPRGRPLELDRLARTTIRAVVDRLLANTEEPQWLGAADLATLLRAAGIKFADAETVAPSEAGAAAERLGFPLVAKAVAPGVLHKSDVGGVILGLNSASAVEVATTTLAERMRAIGTRLDAVLLQREIAGGLDALVGVTTDPTFGPLLVCGLGGVLVELLRDVSFHLTPVTDADARDMLAELRAARLLDGYRGMPAADRDGLVDVILRISALVEIVPEIRELDLNPVKVLPPGHGAVVVDARLRLAPVGYEAKEKESRS